MTPKYALEILKNRVSALAINHKIGSRDIANSEIKEIVTGIETHVIPTIEALVFEHEALKKDVARFMELTLSDYIKQRDWTEYLKLKDKLSKVGKE